MTAQKGSLVLLKIGNGGGPETFATIGGMRSTRLTLDHQPVDTTNLASGAWRALLASAGVQSVTISGGGLFTDSAAEETLRSAAFAGSSKNYELYFGNGDKISGAFHVTEYERAGEVAGHETMELTLESSGIVSFTAGA